MKQNADILEFSLDDKDMERIEKLHRGRRYNDPGDFCQNAFGTFYPLHEWAINQDRYKNDWLYYFRFEFRKW